MKYKVRFWCEQASTDEKAIFTVDVRADSARLALDIAHAYLSPSDVVRLEVRLQETTIDAQYLG